MSKNIVPKFCQTCGGKLKENLHTPGGAPPLICTQCGRSIYLDPKLAAAAVVSIEGHGLVLLRRAQHDGAFGRWILPGGHVDQGEVVSAAAIREVREEIGLKVSLDGLLGVYSYQDNPTVLVVYNAHAVGGEIRPGHEALEVGVFRPDEIPWNDLGYRSTAEALKDSIQKGQNRFLKRV